MEGLTKMAGLDFLNEVIGHTAWPITVFLTLYLFREPLRLLISRIKGMTYKGSAIEFGVQEEIRKQSEKRRNIFDVTKESLTYDNYLDAIMLLSNWYANAVLFISPEPGLDWQRKTAIYTLEQTERKLTEAGRKDKSLELIPVLVKGLKEGLRKH